MLDVNASDLSGIDQYWVNDTGSFVIDIDGILTNASFLPAGSYGIEVRAYDPFNNYCTATLTLTVEDTTDPTWITVPTHQIGEFYQTFSYAIEAEDLGGIDRYWINDTAFSVDGSGVITNASTLAIGTYGVEVRAYDPSDNFCFAIFTITIQDTTAPTWDEPPEAIYSNPGVPVAIDLNASDPSGIHTWWINDTTHFSIGIDGLITNITSLSGGSYGIQVWVNDTYNNVLTAMFTINVDNTPPVWDEMPSDQFAELNVDFTYDLNASDPSGIDFWWINDTINFSIDGNGIITNNSYLLLATYGLQVWVNDTYGHTITAVFNVVVIDTSPPIWTQAPTHQWVELGDAFAYDLDATDVSGLDSWWLNDTARFSIDSAGTITNSSILVEGIYGIRVWVNDTFGNVLEADFMVIVGTTLHVAVVRSYFTDYTTYACWEEINQNWIRYGTRRVEIDYTSLTMTPITLFHLESVGADVLILPYLYTPASPDEIQAIIDYVQQGHGLFATSSLFYEGGDSFAQLFGIQQPPSWGARYASSSAYSIVQPGHPILQGLPDPFSGYYQLCYYPYDTTWDETVLAGAEYLAIDSTGSGYLALLEYRGIVYCSNIPEYMPAYNAQAIQLVYNCITWSQYTFPDLYWDPQPANQESRLGFPFVYDLDAISIGMIDHWWLNDTIHFSIDEWGVITNATTLPEGYYGIQVWVNDTLGNVITASFSLRVYKFIRATVIPGPGTDQPSYFCWSELNSNWMTYGDIQMYIDYTSLDRVSFTLARHRGYQCRCPHSC